MERTSSMRRHQVESPVTRPVLLVEGDPADLTRLARRRIADAGFDLVMCSGPSCPAEACPLVVDGSCPAGRPDVVVCDVQGEWRHSVEAAWRQDGVPVLTRPEGRDLDYAGAALKALFAARTG